MKYKIIFSVLFTFSLCAMEGAATKPKSRNGAITQSNLTYDMLIAKLKKSELFSIRTMISQSQIDLQTKMALLLDNLKEEGLFSDDEYTFITFGINGVPYENKEQYPSIIHDLAVYGALVCSVVEIVPEVFKEGLDTLGEWRIQKFFPKIFNLAITRKCPAVMEKIIAVVAEHFKKLRESESISKKEVREYFMHLVPGFFYADDKEALEGMCDMLGANYISAQEKKFLLGAFDDILTWELFPYDTAIMLNALLTGYCMRTSKESFESFKSVCEIFAVKYSKMYKKSGDLFHFLAQEAETNGHTKIVEYLNELLGAK